MYYGISRRWKARAEGGRNRCIIVVGEKNPATKAG